MIANASDEPTPRPPLTTTFASRSDTPPLDSSTRPMTRSDRSASAGPVSSSTGAGTDADRGRIMVTATGEGVDPAKADQRFERFYRGDSSRTANGAGSGIGLTIAKAIIQAHHGQLLGHSEGPGTGATFEIILPIAPHGDPRQQT